VTTWTRIDWIDAWVRWLWGLIPAWAEPFVRGLLLAVVTLILVRVVIAIATRGFARSDRVDDTLNAFLTQMLGVTGWILVAFAFLGGVGVDATALAAVAAVAGFVIGFAVQDTLGNLAAGVVLLAYRPLKLGEAVSVQGHDGSVTSVGIAMTELRTFDGRYVAIPNRLVVGGSILNHTRNGVRRVEVPVGVSYEDDVDTAIRAAAAVPGEDERVLPEPAPQVLVTGLGESSVDLEVRAWVNVPDFVATKSDLTARVKKAVEDAGCTIPFPQRDIRVYETR
jgi:small conductance mechanosensitive channel